MYINSNTLFLLLCMIFMHIMADYYFQGCLADLKQKSWWEKNHNKEMYKNDYIMALIEHSFVWTFFVMLPMVFYLNFNFNGVFFVVFIFNVALHTLVDHLKANVQCINLVDDQMFHLAQIVTTIAILM